MTPKEIEPQPNFDPEAFVDNPQDRYKILLEHALRPTPQETQISNIMVAWYIERHETTTPETE